MNYSQNKARVYDYVCEWLCTNGTPPKIGDIANGTNLSPNLVDIALNHLRKDGKIETVARIGGGPQGILPEGVRIHLREMAKHWRSQEEQRYVA